MGRRISRRVAQAIVIATGAAATAEQIALCSLQTRIIRADPQFAGGDYYDQPIGPQIGMSIAVVSANSVTAPSTSSTSGSAGARRATNSHSPVVATPSSRTSSNKGAGLNARFDAEQLHRAQ